MKRSLLSLLTMLLLLGITSSPAAASASNSIMITVSQGAEGIRIDYGLPAPRTSLALGGDEGPWPSDRQTLQQPGLRLQDRVIKGDRPFRRVRLLVAPDTKDVDARYPVLTRVRGRGSVLFAPYILPTGRYRLRVEIARGRYRTVPSREAEQGYVIVGQRPRRMGAFDALTDDRVLPQAREFLHERTRRLLAFYAAKLQSPPQSRPTIILLREDATEGHRGFRGDVTPNGVVVLRLRKEPPIAAAEEGSGQISGFLAHEMFHLWNSPRDDVGPGGAWLHEGAADYFSWLAVASLWPGELSLERSIQDALNKCMAFGGSRPIANIPPSLRYACGALPQWLVDLALRSRPGGRSDGFALWSQVLRGNNGVGGYRGSVGALAPETVVLLDQFIGTGWDFAEVGRRTSSLGADVEVGPPHRQSLLFAASRALALSLCSSFGGAGHAREEYFFTVESCGSLGSTVFLLDINAKNPMTAPQATYEEVRLACATGSVVLVRLRGGGGEEKRSVRCTTPVEPAYPDIRIRRALPIPTEPALKPSASVRTREMAQW
jgi:hypothetical protein